MIIAVCQQPVSSVWRVPHFSDFDRRYAAIIWHVIRITVWHWRINQIDGSSFIKIYVAIFWAKRNIAEVINDGWVPATKNSRISWTIFKVVAAKVKKDFFKWWFEYYFCLFLISILVHINVLTSDEGRMLQFIRMLFDKKIQIIKFNMTVVIKIRDILFIHISCNDNFVQCVENWGYNRFAY